MFTGNEKVWPFREQAAPAPRGHKVPVPGDTGGAKLVMELLHDRVREAGAEVRYETGASNLVTGESGSVVGVAWRSFGDTGVLRAGATVIAAGGFVMNAGMVARYTPALSAKLLALGTTYDDGLGIRLGISAGADVRHMDEPFITAPVYPPSVLITGLIVNSRGERFVAEDSYHARTSQFVMEQRDSAAYLIVDSAHVEQPQMPLVPFLDGYHTVTGMEAGLGVPAGSLGKALARYNHYAALGQDPDFRKSAEWLAPQDQGPWAVFDLRLGPRPLRRLHPGGSAHHRRRASTAGGRLRHPGAVRSRGVRLQHRPGRQGLQLGHPARRGVVLRTAGRPARGPPAASEPVSSVPGVRLIQ
jgi:hypothetical protein